MHTPVTLRLYGLLLLMLMIITPVSSFADGSKLAPGDVVTIAVDGEKEFTKAYQISKDGNINLSQVGLVKIVDLSTSDASVAVAKALDKILVSPQVTVAFLERAKMQVYVIGQVTKAGVVEIGAGDRALQALAQAGYDDTADLSRVSLRRQSDVKEIDLKKYLSGEDSSVNVELQSGDTLVVPRSDMVGTVLVSGQVAKPGTVPLTRGMTFREIIGLIGGVTVEADTDHITIKREAFADPIPVLYERAMEGDPTANIPLESHDAIFVPERDTSFFTVIGAVNKPGQHPLKGKLTVSEAIGVAGGPIPSLGDLRKVQVVRTAEGDAATSETVNVDVAKALRDGSEEPVIKRGDIIYVAEHKQKTNILQVIQSLLPLGWLFR